MSEHQEHPPEGEDESARLQEALRPAELPAVPPDDRPTRVSIALDGTREETWER